MAYENAGGVEASLILDGSQYFKTLDEADKRTKTFADQLKSAGAKMESAGKNLTAKVTAPLLGVAAASTKLGVDFEYAMSEVQALSGVSGDGLKELEKKAREMGATTKFSASDAADALKYMGMAGWTAEQMLEGIDGVMMLAAASGEELGTVSDIVTDSLTAFGLAAKDAGHFSDVLAVASSASNTSVGLMGETFKYVGPLAGSLSYSIEDMALATGLMANAGIKGGQAGTALRAAISRLVKPTDDAAVAIEELGIKMDDGKGNMLPLREVLDNMRDSFDGLTDAEKANRAALIFGQEAMSGMLAIINASDEDFDKLAGSIDDATGASKKMSDTMQNNLKGRWQEFQSLLEEVGLQLYEVLLPILSDTLEKFQGWVQAFSELDPATKEMIVKIAGLAAVMGPTLIVAGKFTSALGSIASLAKVAIPAVGGLTTATAGAGAGAAGAAVGVGGLLSSLGSVIAVAAPYALAAAGVAAAGYGVYKAMTTEAIPAVDLFAEHVGYATETVTDEYGNVKTVVKDLSVTISEETATQVGEFIGMADSVKQTFHDMYVGVNDSTDTGLSDVYTKTKEMADKIIEASAQQTDDVIAEYQEMFNSTTVLTDEEQMEIIKTVSDGHQERIIETNKLKDRLVGIYDEIRRQGGQITKSQQEEINSIIEELKRKSVETMSKNEAEQNVIMNRLANSNKRVTAEMVGETIKELNTQRDETVRLAGEQRDELVRQAEELRTLEGGIYADKADKIIEEANRQYEETVEAADSARTNGINKLENAYGDLTDEVDKNTGEILTFWGKVKNWWDSWKPTTKNANINTTQTVTYTERTTKGYTGSSGTGYGAARNARGTNFFQGGLTWVGEQGRELIELPRGTRIYSNPKSEEIAGAGKNLGPLTLNIPVVVDGRQIAKASARYTAEELTELMEGGRL